MPAKHTFTSIRVRGVAQFDGPVVGIEGGGSAPPDPIKRYVALLSQSGVDAPVATILENTLGFTPEWERMDLRFGENAGDEVGLYGFALTGMTIEDKERVFIFPLANTDDAKYSVTVDDGDFDGALNCKIQCYITEDKNEMSALNAAIGKVPFELRLYPA